MSKAGDNMLHFPWNGVVRAIRWAPQVGKIIKEVFLKAGAPACNTKMLLQIQGKKLSGSMHKDLRDSWETYHATYIHANQVDLGKCIPTESMSNQTLFWGMRLDPNYSKLEKALIGTLRALFKKGAPARKLYDSASVVLQFIQGEDDACIRRWYHIGRTNLTSWNTCWMMLSEDVLNQAEANIHGNIALMACERADDYRNRACTVWEALGVIVLRQAVHDMDYKEPCHIRIFKIVDSDDRRVHTDFVPAELEVVACSLPVEFYSGCPLPVDDATGGSKPSKRQRRQTKKDFDGDFSDAEKESTTTQTTAIPIIDSDPWAPEEAIRWQDEVAEAVLNIERDLEEIMEQATPVPAPDQALADSELRQADTCCPRTYPHPYPDPNPVSTYT